MADEGTPKASGWEITPEAWAQALERAEERERQEGAAFPGGAPFPVVHREVDVVGGPEEGSSAPPWFYAVNDRPVKLVRTPEGGLDVLALNMRTGEFERDMSYLTRCLLHEGDVDTFASEAEFEAYVGEVRRQIAERDLGGLP
jgi:hypothetical protein